jgi:hypothetical protein
MWRFFGGPDSGLAMLAGIERRVEVTIASINMHA